MARLRHPSKATPQDRHLARVLNLYPQMAPMVNHLRAGKGIDLPDWPDWCLMPMSGWDAVNTPQREKLASLAAIGTWAFSRGVYSFDPALAGALTDTALSDALPSSVFYRLPEYCVFIEFPDGDFMGDPIDGFWAHLEWDVIYKRPELRLLLLADDGLYPVILHLGDWSVLTALRKAVEQVAAINKRDPEKIDQKLIESIAEQITPLVSMVLYLCSGQPEVDPARQPLERQLPPREKINQKPALHLAPRSIRFEVGARIGRQIRESGASADIPSGRKVRAHLRRAHWHGYWYGPRKGDRQFGYRWLHPILVGGDPEPTATKKPAD